MEQHDWRDGNGSQAINLPTIFHVYGEFPNSLAYSRAIMKQSRFGSHYNREVAIEDDR